ncbi:MAG: VOC family protein [Acidobacteriota bacterium]
MSDATLRGRFVWYDLTTPDPEAAKAFYGEIVGWGITTWEGPTEYSMWTNGDQPIGGVMELSAEQAADGVPPNWVAYIGTPDVDATVDRAKELGGTLVHGPEDIPETGRYAVLKDPQGAPFAVYTPAQQADGPDGPPAAGEFSWHELMTSDYEGAIAFYGELFGWTKTEAMDMGPAGIYQMYGRSENPEMPLGGMMNLTPEMPMPPMWLYYARVPDVHAAAEKAKELGGQVVNGPMEVPGGDWVVQITDPQGAMFALHHSSKGDA